MIPRVGRSPGGGHGNPLQYSCLENSMDGGAWWATVHGVAKSRTRLSDFNVNVSVDLPLPNFCSSSTLLQLISSRLTCFSITSFFFLMWTTFKVFPEFVTVVLLFYVLVFWPRGMWDPDQGPNPHPVTGRGSLNHWIAREIPLHRFLLKLFLHTDLLFLFKELYFFLIFIYSS